MFPQYYRNESKFAVSIAGNVRQYSPPVMRRRKVLLLVSSVMFSAVSYNLLFRGRTTNRPYDDEDTEELPSGAWPPTPALNQTQLMEQYRGLGTETWQGIHLNIYFEISSIINPTPPPTPDFTVWVPKLCDYPRVPCQLDSIVHFHPANSRTYIPGLPSARPSRKPSRWT